MVEGLVKGLSREGLAERSRLLYFGGEGGETELVGTHI